MWITGKRALVALMRAAGSRDRAWRLIWGRHRSFGLLVAALLMLFLSAPAGATATASGSPVPGTLAGTVNFSQPCASGIGVGVAYDGSNLWYSCYSSSPDLFRANPVTGQVTASYDISSGLGSLAYDASRNVIWAGWGGSSVGNVSLIQLDGSKNVVGSHVVFNACAAGECFSDIDDGLTYDAGSDTLYVSPDTATTIDHFSTNGTLLGSFPWAGQSCYNSGLAIGDQLLFEGSDGCSHVWVVDKTNSSKVVFDFSTAVSGDPNFRDEGMACDPNTFGGQGEQVIWSKEAYAPMRAHAFVIPNGSCGVGGEPVSGTAQISYVALGDSFSSGEGNPPFLAGSDQGKDECDRSTRSYSEDFAHARDYNLAFYACSGATTASILNKYNYTEIPQIKEPGVSPSAGLLTLTVGGNDVGFGNVLTYCVLVNYDCTSNIFRIPFTHIFASVTGSVLRKIAVVGPRLVTTYAKLRNATGPNTSIVVLNYPQIFPSLASEQGCASLFPLTSGDQNFFRQATGDLNSQIATAATDAGVNLVDTVPTFSSHEICGNGGSWFNGINWSLTETHNYSFHPTATGQAAYARVLNDYLSTYAASGAPLLPNGLPPNPVPADPPFSVQTPGGMGDNVDWTSMAVHPVTPSAPSCQDTVQPGQLVSISASGYAPSSDLQLIEMVHAANPVDLGIVQATNTGAISQTLRVPFGTPPGAFVGVVAAGSEPGGTNNEVAVAALAVSPQGSTCGTVDDLPFAGFTGPVANLPVVSPEQSGRTLPVSFSLLGIQATPAEVISAGYPIMAQVTCNSHSIAMSGTLASSPGGAGLSYDSVHDRYQFLWKTPSAATGCWQLVFRLVDGTYHAVEVSLR